MLGATRTNSQIAKHVQASLKRDCEWNPWRRGRRLSSVSSPTNKMYKCRRDADASRRIICPKRLQRDAFVSSTDKSAQSFMRRRAKIISLVFAWRRPLESLSFVVSQSIYKSHKIRKLRNGHAYNQVTLYVVRKFHTTRWFGPPERMLWRYFNPVYTSHRLNYAESVAKYRTSILKQTTKWRKEDKTTRENDETLAI